MGTLVQISHALTVRALSDAGSGRATALAVDEQISAIAEIEVVRGRTREAAEVRDFDF
jgi:hypothetical protein